MNGRRVLVVGASSGIGRAVALEAGKRGASVAAAARRLDRLQAIEGAVPLRADVTRPEECDRVVAEAAARLSGLDTLVYAAGASPLASLETAGPDLWRVVVDTNLVGAALVTRAALPHLRASRGRAAYLSAGEVGRPWPGLVPYFAAKAALEELVRGWRTEHPEVGFVTVEVGPTLTDFAAGWDPDLAAEVFSRWQAGGWLPTAGTMAPEEVAAAVVDALAAPVRVHDLRLMPEPRPPAPVRPGERPPHRAAERGGGRAGERRGGD